MISVVIFEMVLFVYKNVNGNIYLVYRYKATNIFLMLFVMDIYQNTRKLSDI